MKILLIIVSLTLTVVQTFGQCTPNSAYANADYGFYPDSVTFLTDGAASAAVAYEAVIDLRTLADTIINIANITTNALFDQFRIIDVTGLPAGFNITYGGLAFSSNNNAWINNGTAPNIQSVSGCISITASANSVTNAAPGSGYTDYPLVITTDARIALTNPDISFVVPNGTWMSESNLVNITPIYDYVLRVHQNTQPCAGVTIDYSIITTQTSCAGTTDGGLEVVVTGGGQTPYNYAWSTGLTGTSSSIDNIDAGFYNVTITDDNGCVEEILNLEVPEGGPTVTLDVLPDICSSNSAFVLTGGSPSGGIYTVNGSQTTEFDPASVGEGTHSVVYTYTDGNNCTVSASQQITVEAAPQVTILGTTAIEPNTSYEYAIDIPSGFSVVWSVTNGIIISGQGSNLLTVFWDQDGSGQVTVTLENLASVCSNTVVSLSVGGFTSVSELDNGYFNISPNPSSGIFQIIVKDVLQNITVSVHDAMGREILNQTILSTGGVVDLSSEPTGIYTILFSTETGQISRRLVKH